MITPWSIPPPYPSDDRSPQPPRPPSPAERSAGLAHRVVARLRLHRRTVGDDVTVQVQNAVVILTGFVPNEAARHTVNRVTWQTPGVHDVNDRVTVASTKDS